MLRLKDETRKLCRWRDHQWKLKEYVVANSLDTAKVFRLFECPQCGRLKTKPGAIDR